MNPIEQFYQPTYDIVGSMFKSNRMDILVLGAGYVGQAVADKLHSDLGASVDLLTFGDDWTSDFSNYDVVINCAAVTNTKTDLTLQQLDDMVVANLNIPLEMARSSHSDQHIIHVSTACLRPDVRDTRFSHDSPVLQAEGPYYATKLLAEAAIRKCSKSTIVRPRLIYDQSPTDKNMLVRLRKYSAALNCPQSVTCLHTLVAAICWMIYYRHDSGIKGCADYDVVDRGDVALNTIFDNENQIECHESRAMPTKVADVQRQALYDTGFTAIDSKLAIDTCVKLLLQG